MPRASQRGIQNERRTRRLLEDDGWWTCRAAGSLGDADVLALKAGERPRMIEVKSTKGGPWEKFGPADRRELLEAANRAGADALLCWWPPRKSHPEWIESEFWPLTRSMFGARVGGP